MFGKKKKKLDRRMRRRIRKTSAVMLLISAITVAAIPVPEAAAADGITELDDTAEVTATYEPNYTENEAKVTSVTENYKSIIPEIKTTDTIYTSEENLYQFAYSTVDGDDVAVLLNSSNSAINGNVLTIPRTLEAYVRYTKNQGSEGGYAAANAEGNWVYYKEVTKHAWTRTASLDENGNVAKDENGNISWVNQYQAVPNEVWVVKVDETPVSGYSEIGRNLEQNTITYQWVYHTYRYKVCYSDATEKAKWASEDIQKYVLRPKSEGGTYDYDDNDKKYVDLENMSYYDFPTEIDSNNWRDFVSGYNSWDEIPKYSMAESGNNTQGIFARTGTTTRWLNAVVVGAISSQRAKRNPITNVWELAVEGDDEFERTFTTDPPRIQTLNLPNSLIAIAGETFADCSALTSVSFGGTVIKEIGPYAFKNCRKLENFTIPGEQGVTMIMEGTFENCQSLTNFVIPNSVEAIGDDAFKNCISLSNVTFDSRGALTKLGRNVFENTALETVILPESLEHLGYGTFKNCTNLKEVVLPKTNTLNGTESIDFSTFEGCTALESIDVLSNSTTFNEKNVEAFKKNVGDKFFFIGEDDNDSEVYKIAFNNEIAFQDRATGEYEKAVKDKEADIKYLYRVDSKGNLLGIGFYGTGTPTNVEIPSRVGKYNITTIGSQFSQSNAKDKLTTLTIPATITTIEEDAFKGCTSLEKVIFEEPNNITTIGKEAFYTQYYGAGDTRPSKLTELTFEGEINAASVPFQYAMDANNTINNPNQTTTYIDFCSGSPTYIHVKYNPTKDKSEVWWVPVISEKADDDASKKAYAEYIDAIAKRLEDYPVNDVSGGEPMEPVAVLRAYDKYLDGEGSITLSPNVEQVVRSAFYITLPSGIQTIASGLFSEATADNTTVTHENLLSNAASFKENAAVIPGVDGTGIVKINNDIRQITMEDIEELDDYAFYGCENLQEVVMYSSGVEGGESIGNYAFGQCENLTSAILPTTTSSVGVRPFAADEKLETAGVSAVQFTGEAPSVSGVQPGRNTSGDNFMYENGILYEKANGAKDAIVQVLPTRGSVMGSTMVGSTELAGVNSIYPEAFKDCTNIGIVDLEQSNVTSIPEFCFDNADRLTTVTLPITCKEVMNYGFKDSGLTIFTVPYTETRFSPYAFYDSDPAVTGHILRGVEVITAIDSTAEDLAESYAVHNWKVSDERVLPTCTITFQDTYGNVIAERRVKQGEDVEAPTPEEMSEFMASYPELYTGKYFAEWFPAIFSPAGLVNTTVTARFSDTPLNKWIVEFRNDDYSVLATYEVEDGNYSPTPQTPTSTRGEYAFTGWSNADGTSIYEPIKQNVTFMANYSYPGSGSGDPNDPNNPDDPNNPNNPNGGNGSNGNNGTNGSDGANGGNGTNGGDGANGSNGTNNGTLYTLTVVNGSGSGDYAEGTTVVIAAFDPNTGYEFYNWTSSETDTDFASKTMSATTFKMPAKNLTVTANYRTKSETGNSITSRRTQGTVTSAPSSNTGSVSSTNNNGNSGNGNSGSSVQVSRPGISDTVVASATVNGSTDNFVVKVTEDGQATAAVAEALRNEYGDLSNIHYFAMDISLYDETGTTKITDTNGVSVTITLPIPDELRQYGGNNKVGAVTGGNNLDKLNARFTTVHGVPCVTFTATHFSPYTIYVDTANLSEGNFDTTPKTGDGIHPKWFLAIGLALLSVVLFLKKDKKVSPSAA